MLMFCRSNMFFLLLSVSAISTLGLALHAVADCTLAGCTDKGPKNATCPLDNGQEDYCEGADATQCGNDNFAMLYSGGLFVCSGVLGKCNCRTSASEKDVCYGEFSNCIWDEDGEFCFEDDNSIDPTYDWIKVADNCAGD